MKTGGSGVQQVLKFFKTIFLVDLVKGLLVTLRYTPRPAFTFQYPAERRPVAPRFRGVLRLQVDDHDEPITELRRLVEIAAERRERRRQ